MTRDFSERMRDKRLKMTSAKDLLLGTFSAAAVVVKANYIEKKG